jgi:hypothetical protein
MVLRHVSPQAVAIDNCFLEEDPAGKKGHPGGNPYQEGEIAKANRFHRDHL